jgi:hypothetical protein
MQPPFFEALVSGAKEFTVRLNQVDPEDVIQPDAAGEYQWKIDPHPAPWQPGDVILLREWDRASEYSGRMVANVVTFTEHLTFHVQGKDSQARVRVCVDGRDLFGKVTNEIVVVGLCRLYKHLLLEWKLAKDRVLKLLAVKDGDRNRRHVP